jgi:hypothetical protein
MVTEEGGGDKYTVPGKELLKRKAMIFEAGGMYVQAPSMLSTKRKVESHKYLAY